MEGGEEFLTTPEFKDGGKFGLGLDEGQQFLVDLILERCAHAVRRTLDNFQRCVFDDLGRKQRRVGIRYNLIVVAMKHQGRHVNFLQVLGQIRL